MTSIRQSLLSQNIPERVSKIPLVLWKERTEKQYESAWKQFCRWCHKKSVNPFSYPLDSILQYQICMKKVYNIEQSTVIEVQFP